MYRYKNIHVMSWTTTARLTSVIAEHTVSTRTLALHNHVFPRIVVEHKDEIERLEENENEDRERIVNFQEVLAHARN